MVEPTTWLVSQVGRPCGHHFFLNGWTGIGETGKKGPPTPPDTVKERWRRVKTRLSAVCCCCCSAAGYFSI
jgi:hypothetical protein